MPTPLNPQRRLEDVDRQLADVGRRLKHRAADPETPLPRNVRLAITGDCEDDYPHAPANVYPIRFADGSFPLEPGLQAVTLRRRSLRRRTFACNLRGLDGEHYVPPGTPIEVFEQNGRWWFEYGDPEGGSGSCGSGSEESGSSGSAESGSSGSEESGSSGSAESGSSGSESGSSGSGSDSGSSGSGESSGCNNYGIDLAALDVIDGSAAAYVLVEDQHGCLKKIRVRSCGGSGSQT